jgi:hypothetical protein
MGQDLNTVTLQSNIKEHSKDMTQYSLFLGGLNVTSKALEQYDPLKTGFARIFFLKMPTFMNVILPEKTKKIKHLMQYGFTGVDGIQNTTMDFEQITGGYAGRQFDIATTAKDETNEITLKLYEFAGSPVREYMDMWLTGISDPYTGIGHYHDAMNTAVYPSGKGLTYSQVNHTAEAIYVQTDPTGQESGIEYACLLCNMMPKQVKKDHFNYESGSHPVVQVDLPFTCTKYESPQINKVATALVKKYKILRDYLKFYSGYDIDGDNIKSGATVLTDAVNITDWKDGATA